MNRKASIEFVKHWILPKGFQDILINLYEYRRWHNNIVKKNDKIKNIYYGKRCFIIGNGPSLNSQDLNKLKDEYTFVVNDFFMTELFDKINPFGYVIADPGYIDESKFSIERLTKLDQKCKNQNLFFPSYATKIIQKYNLFKSQHIYYIEMFRAFHEDPSRFNLDLTKSIPGARTVIIMAIMVAAYMGFNEIYLLGCDSDWAKYPASKGCLPHFYSEKNTLKPEISLAQDWMYENVLDSALVIFRDYRLLNNALRQKNVQVLNATNGGFLDMFERVDYEALFDD